MFVIFNPASGRGRGEERQQTYIELLNEAGVEFEIATTSGPGGESDLTERALSNGATTIVAVGGDGTWSNVAGRILASGRTDVSLGLLPAGSGNDFAKSFGITYRNPAGAVQAVARGRARSVDVGRIRFPEEDTPDRHFLLETSFGIGPAVLRAANGARFLKGNLLYSVTAIQQIFRFKGVLANVGDLNGPITDGRHLMLVVANAPNMGGTFLIAPEARLDDGKLDVCAIEDAGALERLHLFRMVGAGEHGRSDRVTFRQSGAFTIRFTAPVPYEVDGELLMSTSRVAQVDSVPRALRVLEATP
ncbi:MAG: diacylglycerol kinase family lipid kinase [Gemmatimonadota bacterium]|nr:MAG: diacylglycerol kinase family lipid kinase [Gemmatimonadota bacterium]